MTGDGLETTAAPLRRIELVRHYPCPPEAVFAPLERIGGETGYYYADWLWRLRAALDRLVGGPARRNGRPERPLTAGDVVDFWRVERCEPGRLLRLRAEMKLPGRGWLQFEVEPEGDGALVRQTALFDPAGWWGRVYWYALYPIHDLIFRGMLRNLRRHMNGTDSVGRAGKAELTRPLVRPRQVEGEPPCRAACPGGGDVRAWVTLVAQRRVLGLSEGEAYARAWSMIVERNPFPAVTGRICPHPCEDGCNRRDKDGPVAVHLIERFLGDWALRAGRRLAPLDPVPWAESIGVIGAGPAGLSFAYQMARRGYSVTVYEEAPKPGGMLRYGIPAFRLPREVLDAEIDRIVELGVALRCGVRVGRDVAHDELSSLHHVLFLGIGAQHGRRLGIPGEDGPGVWSGVAYLGRVNAGEAVDTGRRTVVIGGGDTAIDAARTARRSGADVTLVYRRSRTEMPAADEEVDEAVEEGVRLRFRLAPLAVERHGARVRSLRVQRIELGEADESGRARPLPVEGSEHSIPADTVIVAVAQSPDWSDLDAFRPDGPWIVPDELGRVGDHVWGGGDAIALGIASAAIGHGRRAAEAVHARLRGIEAAPAAPGDPIRVGRVKPERYRERERSTSTRLSVDARLARPGAEVHRGLAESQFLAEVERCLSCGTCMGCEQCWMYCVHDCFTRLDEPRPGAYFAVSIERCRACGKCVDLCPCGFLDSRSDELR